jgi:exonuclease SbcC
VIPVRLKLRNFLSHDHSVINFNNFNSALIFGIYNDNADESNGTGKSAILEAISWVLFDKARHKKKDGVVKRDASACFVMYDFIIGKQLYRIIRKRNKVVSETDVTFEQWNGTKYESIDCDTNTATDHKIIQTINFTHDVFINSIYVKQGDISRFTESTPSKRKDILKSLLKLDKWDNYQKRVKKHHGKISTQINEKQKNQISLELLEDEIEGHDIDIKKIEDSLNEKNKLYSKFNDELIEKKSEFQFLEDDHNGQQRLSELEDNLTNFKKRLSKIKKITSANVKLIKANVLEVKKNKMLLSAYNVKIKAKKGINLSKKRAGLFEGQTKEKITREKIEHLKKDIQLEKQCDTCLRPIESKKEAKRIKQVRQAELNSLRKKHNILTKKLKVSEAAFKKLENIVLDGQKAELEKSKISIKLTSLENDVKRIVAENNNLSKEEDKINITELKKEISTLKSKLNKNNISKLKNDIEKTKNKLFGVKKSIDKLNIEYGSKVSNRKELSIKYKEQKSIDEELVKLNDKLIVYDKLRQYFGKDGIQSIIIENVVDELENYTNTTLSKICNEPTSINIQMQRQSDSGSWTETFEIEVNIDNRKDEFEALSGGEKFRISLALRLAFSKILSKRMGGVVKFLLLDEVSSSLDPKGLNMFAEIVKKLSSEMKILVITHDDRLKDKFEDVIIVEKDSNGSRANI